MLRGHLRARGIADPRVLQAMAEVPRERFVAPGHERLAYEDAPLPIGEGQTISQPYMVAWMAEAAEIGPRDRVLEVGTGTGYSAAVLGRIARVVHTVERHASLAEAARARLRALRCRNVHVRCGDGACGWPERAPFDAILVAAGAASVPAPLREQMAAGGRLVVPVGPATRPQTLTLERLDPSGARTAERLGAVRFVPLVRRDDAVAEGGARAG